MDFDIQIAYGISGLKILKNFLTDLDSEYYSYHSVLNCLEETQKFICIFYHLLALKGA